MYCFNRLLRFEVQSLLIGQKLLKGSYLNDPKVATNEFCYKGLDNANMTQTEIQAILISKIPD